MAMLHCLFAWPFPPRWHAREKSHSPLIKIHLGASLVFIWRVAQLLFMEPRGAVAGRRSVHFRAHLPCFNAVKKVITEGTCAEKWTRTGPLRRRQIRLS
jgi:hypothetical protein